MDEDLYDDDRSVGMPNPARMAAVILGRPLRMAALDPDLSHTFGLPSRRLWQPADGSLLYATPEGAVRRVEAFLAQTRALGAFGPGGAEGVVRRRWRVALAVHGPTLFPPGWASRGVARRLRALDLDPDRDLAELDREDPPGTAATPWSAAQRLAEPCARAAARLAVAHRAGRADVAAVVERGPVDPVDALEEACGEEPAQFLPDTLEPLTEACDGDVLRGCAVAWTRSVGAPFASPNLAARHAYTVLGVLRDGAAPSHLVLRNPSGLCVPAEDPRTHARLAAHPAFGPHAEAGLVPVPLDVFAQAFVGYALTT